MGSVSVEIGMEPPAHALLSASSAERWITCTPSARIEEALPDVGSAYASDGTAAHAFAELRLRYLLDMVDKDEYRAGYLALKDEHAEYVEEWETSDWEAINAYVDYVMSEYKRLGGTIYIERRVDYSRYAPEGFGTSDAIIFSPESRVIKSIDLKFGKGVPVSAVNNTQARLYALGALLNVDTENVVESVEWAIVQPRLSYIGEDSETVESLLNWAETVVAPAAKLAYAGEGELKPSAKACQFCKAKATCRARAAENVLIARRDFVTLPDPRLDDRLMTPEEVARILPDIDGWMDWAKALKEYATAMARDRGEQIPGYKLVRGRSNRAWKPGVDVAATLREAGIPDEAIYPPPTGVRSVAQMEKELGKKRFSEVAQPLVVQPPGAPTLVPDTDPRPAIDAAAEAREAFASPEHK